MSKVHLTSLGPSSDSEETHPPTLTEAVKALRLTLGDTQQQFAQRLGLAISTVVRYESTRAPRGDALAKLYKLALDNKLRRIAAMFQAVVLRELGEPPNRKHLAETEAVLTELLEKLEDKSFIGQSLNPSEKVEAAIDGIEKTLRLIEEMKPFSMTSTELQDEAFQNTWEPEQVLESLITEKLRGHPEMSRESAFLDVQVEHPEAFKRVLRARDLRGNQPSLWEWPPRKQTFELWRARAEWQPGKESFESWKTRE